MVFDILTREERQFKWGGRDYLAPGGHRTEDICQLIRLHGFLLDQGFGELVQSFSVLLKQVFGAIFGLTDEAHRLGVYRFARYLPVYRPIEHSRPVDCPSAVSTRGPIFLLIPNSVTIFRAISVAFCRSLPGPVVVSQTPTPLRLVLPCRKPGCC